ncbi:hypothetical protein H6G51_18220 [Limnothrix sp. FACHB-708]|uniref:hypothetical protein n=1 Tax=unclassified Limnothrix TaxID=2632864 RepID=UPI001684E699|nr:MULTISPECIES: hypothetical protein [unclassified Limnothrix]MBD2555225.1 hypothetical protein [Limnothrix sp. FACHB-708]MBD2592644.1 hypothetical protein [Limnothrix sp. FACHB-406]
MHQQQQHRPHPELTDRVAWMPVSLQSPPPPPAPKAPPFVLPVACFLTALLGYSIAMGHRDWQLLQAKQQAQQAQQGLQQAQQDKARYCQEGS